MPRKKKEDEMPEDEKETTNEAPETTEGVAVESDPLTDDETIEVPLTAEAAETPAEDVEAPADAEAVEGPEDGAEALPEGDTFPRAYVEKLRRESAEYRVKAQRVDELGERLHAALVTADGRLADPGDLPYDPAYLDDPAALDQAVADLLARKPHLASRKPRGNIGMGANRPSDDSFSLAGLIRSKA